MQIAGSGDANRARVTIRQVAEQAGVSIATVSRVLNGRTDVSVSTRETVQRVLREQGYRAGARPGPGHGRRAGVLLPLLHPTYFAELLAGIAEALHEQDIQVVLCPTAHSHQREMSLVADLASGQTDGALLVLPEESPAELAGLAGRGFPFVVVDPRGPVPEDVPVVCAAHSSGASQMVGHLLGLGHRRIGVIAGPAGWLATEERLRGYHAALAGAGVLPSPELVEHADFRLASGHAAALRLLSLPRPPTAIFAFNDRMAIGAMRAAAGRGLHVPADLSVAGYDDTTEAAIAVPALTTVRQPLAELGRTAVSLLLRQMDNRRLEPLRVELATRLVVRDSTGKPARPGDTGDLPA